MNARYFDVDNFLMTAPDITGHGVSLSIFTRPVLMHPYFMMMTEKNILSPWTGRQETGMRSPVPSPWWSMILRADPSRVTLRSSGGVEQREAVLKLPTSTRRQPLLHHDSEGGTGYYHSVTIAAPKSWGPYEGDPQNPVITSQPLVSDERSDVDHLKPRYYNPESLLQKSGHAAW